METSHLARSSSTLTRSRMLEIPGYPQDMARVEGPYAYAASGRRYIDMHMALGTSIIGHTHPEVSASAKAQIERGVAFPTPHSSEERLSAALAEIVKGAEVSVFGKNGNDVVALAVRLARHVTHRSHVISVGYHGWIDATIHGQAPAGIPNPVRSQSTALAIGGTTTAAALEQIGAHAGDLAAVVVELNAFDAFGPEDVLRLAVATREVGALFVMDEIVTGFRMALGGASARFGIDADLVCVGKALGNGFAVSALCGGRALLGRLNEVYYSLTYATDPVAFEAALTTLRVMRTLDYDGLWARGVDLKAGLNHALGAAGMRTRAEGRGPYLRLVAPADEQPALLRFLGGLVERDILVSHVNPILPSFAHNPADLAYVIEAAHAAARAV